MRTSVDLSGLSGPVLLFDGECGLCQRVVRWLLRLDRRGSLRFAPLQGPTAQAYLRRHCLDPVNFDSLVFIPEWRHRARPEFLLRTDAVIAALKTCGGPARLLAGFGFFPRRVRDAAYALVARWRHRLFGRGRLDPAVKKAWAERFID